MLYLSATANSRMSIGAIADRVRMNYDGTGVTAGQWGTFCFKLQFNDEREADKHFSDLGPIYQNGSAFS